jgi:glycosyltransferase involved in cell wall biosynthesis
MSQFEGLSNSDITSLPKAPLEKAVGSTPTASTKPRILIIPDSPGWAFDSRCNALMAYLGRYFQFDKMYFKWMDDRDYSVYDLVYFMGFFQITHPRNKAKDLIPVTKLVTSVTGMVTHPPEEVANNLDLVATATTMNQRFYDILQPLTKTKLYCIPNGTHAYLFTPSSANKSGPFTIGWAGNIHHKGKRVEILQETAAKMNIPLLMASVSIGQVTALEKPILYEDMPEFYRSIDCYVCTSISEGSNNCLIEAASCGIPIISTDTGNARELISTDGGYLLNDDLSDLAEKINMMQTANRESMGKALRKRVIQDWDWRTVANKFMEVFYYALGR